MKIGPRRRAAAVAAVLVLCVLATLPAAATDRVTRLHHRQHRVDARQHRLEREIRRATQDQTGLLARITTLDAHRSRVAAEVRSLDSHIAVLSRRIHTTRLRLRAATRSLRAVTDRLQSILRRLDARTTLFTARAVASYEAGPTAGIEGLLSAESFGELMNRLKYYQSAMSADAALIQQIKTLSRATENHRAAAAAQRNEIRATKRTLEADRTALSRKRARQRSALASLKRVVSQKHAAVTRIEHRKAQLQAAIAEAARESAQIEALLQVQGGSGSSTATLSWPVIGPITSGFGWRTHPIFHTREFHPGIDIGASYGTTVRAAATGVVAFAGRMTGYGNVLVIDHGGGLATLYGHLSAFAVSQGRPVARGAPIARVGCTGWCTGPHLHFEVRISGRPVNPVPYLR